MDYLVDTSVLVRAVHPPDPARATAVEALRTLRSSGHRLCVFPQNLAEFWFVCTRPVASNGLGYSFVRTRRYVSAFEPLFELFYETAEVYQEWRRLLDQHEISGCQLFDARLVAAATVNRFDYVLTFDVTHTLGAIPVSRSSTRQTSPLPDLGSSGTKARTRVGRATSRHCPMWTSVTQRFGCATFSLVRIQSQNLHSTESIT